MITFTVEGMSCDHCKKAVIGALAHIDPEATSAVDLEDGRVTIGGSQVPATRFAAAIEEAGYEVTNTREG